MSDYPVTAFPTTEANYLNENVRTEGMELRDYFAAKAMQALITVDKEAYQSDIARYAYAQADAMLTERIK